MVGSDGGGATKVDDLRISIPAGGRGKFLAKVVNDELQLLALEGKVELTQGQRTEPVPATTGVKIKLPKRSKGPKEPSRRPRGSWLNNDDLGLLIVVSAAITASVIVGIVNSQNAQPVTPAAP